MTSPDAKRRPWPRLHPTTYLVALLAAGVLFLANVGPQMPVPWEEDEYVRIAFGWPWTVAEGFRSYYGSEGFDIDQAIWSDSPIFRDWQILLRWELAGNVVVAGLIVAQIVLGAERRRRRRGGALRTNLRELLLATTLLALLCGYVAREGRRAAEERAALSAPGVRVDGWILSRPAWCFDLLGRLSGDPGRFRRAWSLRLSPEEGTPLPTLPPGRPLEFVAVETSASRDLRELAGLRDVRSLQVHWTDGKPCDVKRNLPKLPSLRRFSADLPYGRGGSPTNIRIGGWHEAPELESVRLLSQTLDAATVAELTCLPRLSQLAAVARADSTGPARLSMLPALESLQLDLFYVETLPPEWLDDWRRCRRLTSLVIRTNRYDYKLRRQLEAALPEVTPTVLPM